MVLLRVSEWGYLKGRSKGRKLDSWRERWLESQLALQMGPCWGLEMESHWDWWSERWKA